MTLRLPAAVLTALVLLVLAAPVALAHPLGNFTTNTSVTILPADPTTEVVYVLDLAEVPTQQAGAAIAAAGGQDSWAAEECTRIAGTQSLVVDDRPADLAVTGVAIATPEGEAGLDTLRLTCALQAATPDLADPTAMTYADGHAADRSGWREIIAVGDGSTILRADVPSTSATDQLRAYPDAAVSTVTTASLLVDPTQGDAAPAAVRASDLAPVEEGPGGWEGVLASYTDMVSRQTLTPPFVALAVLVSIALGTAHAVAPGHGKTVIAAYLLGDGGQARQAVALGGTVAVTHTIGVLVLGVVVQTSAALAPESLYPILGIVGGVLFTLLGAILLRRALRTRGHGHRHGNGHSHDHLAHDHGHSHAHGDHDHPTAPATSWRMLVLPGLAGGMVPSPSALVVLLGGIALGRTWFGILLVLFYGVGMALALVGAGYLLHRVRFRVIERIEGPTWARVSGALPIATSALIVVGGLVIVGRAALTA